MQGAKFTKSDFDYALPKDLIALQPYTDRTSSRLMVLSNNSTRHLNFLDLPTLLRSDDLLIVNDTKVIKARLHGNKSTGGKVEILIERIESTNQATCQVRASRGFEKNHTVMIGPHRIRMIERIDDMYRLHFSSPVTKILDEYGEVPLPSYIERPSSSEDEERYQTVYASKEGAVAAPTAGLHFTNELLESIRSKGVRIEKITLHVGAGTFQPLRQDSLADVRMHSERYFIPHATRTAIDRKQGRVVAIGTTVVRTLESAALTGQDEGETRLFITPGFKFRVVDALVTNFHLPESTLIMLVCAFCGYKRVMDAYAIAVRERYRFYSYGDAMWCERDAV